METTDAASLEGRPARVWPGWLACFVAFGLLYGLTAARDIQWQDSGHFILRIVTGELVNELGIALSHPLHFWLGRAAMALTGLEPAFAITLVSSLGGALTVANLYGAARTLTGRRAAALFAAVSLGLANVFWHLSTVAECYTVTTALLSAELWCLIAYARHRRGWMLIAAALANGVGLANHNLAALTTPIIVWITIDQLVRRRISFGAALAAAAAWIIGTLPLTLLSLVQWLATGDLAGTIRSTLFGHGYQSHVLGASISVRQLGITSAFIALSFPNLFLLLAALGLVRRRRPSVPLMTYAALVAALVIHAAFVLRYNVIDQHTFLLPTLCVLALFAAVGFSRVQTFWPPRWRKATVGIALALLLLTPVVYFIAPRVARHYQVLEGFRNKPYRDDYTYLFVPWAVVETSAARMSSEALELAGDDGLILVEDNMATFAARYRAVLARRRTGSGPEVLSADSADAALLAAIDSALAQGRAVVLVPRDRDDPDLSSPHLPWERVGDLYRISPPPSP